MGDLLTIHDVAARLKVAACTVRGLVKRGRLSVVRLSDGSRSPMRFRPEDVDAFIAARLRPAKLTPAPVEPAAHPVRTLPGARRYVS